MKDLIIVAIIAALLVVGVIYTRKHFRGEGGCCGGSPVKKQSKKISKSIGKKRFLVEGMTCENCKNRIEKAINALEGVVGKVSLSKKEVVVSYNREVTDEEIIQVIEKCGFKVRKM